MTDLLKWILNPGGRFTLERSGGGGGGDSGAQAAQAEAEKEALRQRINSLYGGDAAPALDAEKARLGEATTGYYNDQLGRSYGKAVRENKFALARHGQIGGSVEADKGAELQTDLNLGSTRVSEAARRAMAGLDVGREQERLQAINLAGSGAGESSVGAAATGLRNAFANAETANKADILGGLFKSGAQASEMSSNATRDAQLAAMMRAPRLSSPSARTATETSSF
jgi:hypothetical protein